MNVFVQFAFSSTFFNQNKVYGIFLLWTNTAYYCSNKRPCSKDVWEVKVGGFVLKRKIECLLGGRGESKKQTSANKGGGGGGQKSPNLCERNNWMVPRLDFFFSTLHKFGYKDKFDSHDTPISNLKLK